MTLKDKEGTNNLNNFKNKVLKIRYNKKQKMKEKDIIHI
jgi:hypothetical protein